MAKRILIVDDNKPLSRMMVSALETLPYQVKVNTVPSGEEALLSVMLEKPDLMVVDMNLPGMNGLDLIQILRDRYDDMKIVMATGEHDSSIFRRAEELGVEYRFPKPFETVAFLDAVNRILHGQGLDTNQLSLPSEPPERMEDSAPELSFSDAVVELHERLGALTVVMVGVNAHIVVQAGNELSKVFSENWEMPIMSALSAIEGMQRIAPGEPKAQFQVFQTSETNIIVTPVGRHGLIVVLPSKSDKAFFNNEIATILEVQQRISTFTPPFDMARDHDATGSLQPDVVPEEEIEEEEVEVQDIDIASLFSAAAEETTADSFWSTEESEEDATAVQGEAKGYLDFSQAQQLGLTPDDDE